MRDRREALKLLAGGTAAALGTSIITTSTVHADGGTIPCRPSGDVSDLNLGETHQLYTASNGRTTALRLGIGASAVNLGAKTCPSCSAGSPVAASTTSQYLWTFDDSPLGFGFYLAETVGAAITSFTSASSVPASIFIRRTNGSTFQGTNNSTDIFDFDVRLTVRWRCQYGTSPALYSWNCQSYTASIQWRSNGSDPDSAAFVADFAAAGAGTACDSDSPPAA